MRVCACICGGILTAYRGDPDDLAEVVAAHNGSRLHRAWRRNREKVDANAARRARLRAEISSVRLLRALELERLGLRL